MAAYTSGAALDGVAELEERGAVLDAARRRHVLPPRLRPAAHRPGLVAHGPQHPPPPGRHSPAAMLSGWLPARVHVDGADQLARRDVRRRRLARAPGLLVRGRGLPHRRARRRSAATTRRRRAVGDAVAASCAIPGFYAPRSIAGRRYVDGGICSMSNLDLLCGAGLDLVVCLNPTSSLAQVASRSPSERFGAALRAASGRRVGHEARKLRERGTEVLLLQPGADDLQDHGRELHGPRRRLQVGEQALRSTALRPARAARHGCRAARRQAAAQGGEARRDGPAARRLTRLGDCPSGYPPTRSGDWCNGNIGVSKTLARGSIPRSPARVWKRRSGAAGGQRLGAARVLLGALEAAVLEAEEPGPRRLGEAAVLADPQAAGDDDAVAVLLEAVRARLDRDALAVALGEEVDGLLAAVQHAPAGDRGAPFDVAVGPLMTPEAPPDSNAPHSSLT